MNHTFYVQAECLEAIKTLPTEKRNAMLGAIAGYQIDGSMPDFENEMQVIFLIAKVFMDQRKRRSASHSRKVCSQQKAPKAKNKSTRESITEILAAVETTPTATPESQNTKEVTPDNKPAPTSKPQSLPTGKQQSRKNENDNKEISDGTRLAIKKLTALCNQSKHKRK